MLSGPTYRCWKKQFALFLLLSGTSNVDNLGTNQDLTTLGNNINAYANSKTQFSARQKQILISVQTTIITTITLVTRRIQTLVVLFQAYFVVFFEAGENIIDCLPSRHFIIFSAVLIFCIRIFTQFCQLATNWSHNKK
jgi:hypothetical protein